VTGLEEHHVAVIVGGIGRITHGTAPGGFVGKMNTVRCRSAKRAIDPLPDKQRLRKTVRDMSNSRRAISTEDAVTLFLIGVQVGWAEIGDVAAHRVLLGGRAAHRDEGLLGNRIGRTKKRSQVPHAWSGIGVVPDGFPKVELTMQRALLQHRQNQRSPAESHRVAKGIRFVEIAGRQDLMCRRIVVQREPKLFEIVATLRSASGFSGRLNCGQQQRDQNCNDRDHDQKFDQCKPSLPLV